MKIELPQVGESVTEGIIGKWLKQVGDRVEKYDLLVEVVTDKVNMEMPSPVSGVLTHIHAEENETVPMGAVIAEILVEGETGDASVPTTAMAPETAAVDRTGVLVTDVAPVGPTGSGGALLTTQETTPDRSRVRHSPAVQRLAEANAVDLARVQGSGVGGRITRKDVEAHIASSQGKDGEAPGASSLTAPSGAPSEAREEERLPLTPVRRMIAANMVKSASQIPQAWTTLEVDVSGLVQRRASVKEEIMRREGVNITYLPFVVHAVAAALKDNPLLNSSWDGDAIIVKRRINLGLAMAGADGLVVPVIHDADGLSILALAKAIDDLTGRARQGKLQLSDVQGGTFTVNNTGALGSVVSQPLVNHPQAAIITTEAIVKRPVVVNDAIAIRSMMNLCLTFDHRVLDGAEAGAFINEVKHRLEAIGPDVQV